MRRLIIALAVIGLVVAASILGCSGPRSPLSGGLLVTFDASGEVYKIFVMDDVTIDQVLAVQRGESRATIPNGRVIEGSVPYNKPWTWHIDPKDIQMVEVSAELSDGRPSDVEADVKYWTNTVKRFSPWNARIVKVEDFR